MKLPASVSLLTRFKTTSLLAEFPAELQNALCAPRMPADIAQAIADREVTIALYFGRHGCIDCDQAATLMSEILLLHAVVHERVIGKTDAGVAHAWVRVNGVNYDPTAQGFGDGRFEVVEILCPPAEFEEMDFTAIIGKPELEKRLRELTLKPELPGIRSHMRKCLNSILDPMWDDNTFVVLLRFDGRIVGWSLTEPTAHRALRTNPGPDHVYSVFIDPEYRNRGFGSWLAEETVLAIIRKFGSGQVGGWQAERIVARVFRG